MIPVCGVINLDKPEGMTSHTAVGKTRRLFDRVKGGHCGTLDPAATGVLPVLLGAATRFSQFLMEKNKEYVADIQLGVKTNTGDMTGEVVQTCGFEEVTEKDVSALLPRFMGTITQTPPLYSAIQVNGRRLYDIARAGEQVEVPSRQVQILELELLSFDRVTGRVRLRVACGKGTYIRTLAEDLGEALGCGAALAILRRTVAGPFSIEKAVTLEQLEEAAVQGTIKKYLTSVEDCFLNLPVFTVDPFYERLMQNGQAVDQRKLGLALSEGSLARAENKGAFSGLYMGIVVEDTLCLKYARQL